MGRIRRDHDVPRRALDAIWGLGGILNDDVVVVGGRRAIIGQITLRGDVHLVLGSIIAITGVGLLPRQDRRPLARRCCC